MKSYFYALWIPQYKEGKPFVKETKLDEIELRDTPEAQSLRIYGEINPETLLICLHYKIDGVEGRPLLFHLSDWKDTGFLVYKLNLDDAEDNFLCNRLRTSMSKAIYHYVKGFFHEHQFHGNDDDSLLNSYFSSVAVRLDDETVMKDILYIYLQSYIDKYAGCVSLSRETLHRVSENIKNGIKFGDSQEELAMVMENNQIVIDGESLYCDFLIDSYSELVSTNQLQRIYGLRNELARYDERMARMESSISSEKSIQIGKIGIWASFIGAIAGLIVSFVLSMFSSKELQQGIDSLRQDVNKAYLHQNHQNRLDRKELKSLSPVEGCKIEE